MARPTKQPDKARKPDRKPPAPEAEPPPKLPGRALSSAQFWALMERWKVPDVVALELIQFPGKDREIRQAAVQVHHQAKAADVVYVRDRRGDGGD